LEQLVKDLPIISILKQTSNKFVDKSLINNLEKYLDLLSETYVMLDINPKDLSPIEEAIIICDQILSLSDKFELKRTNESMDRSLKHLRTDMQSLKDKLNDSVREMKTQTSFETSMAEKIKFYAEKCQEYRKRIKSNESTLSKIGFTAHLKHESISQIKENNEELRNRLNDINARLNECKDFNPTESDLKKRISELKVELSELDHIFNKV